MPVHPGSTDCKRRRLLQAVAGLTALPWFGLDRVLAAEAPGGRSNAFDFNQLITRARRLAAEPYTPTPPQAPELLDRITYDVYQKIGYRPGEELADDARYGVRLFHLGKYAKQPVGINLIEDGRARSIRYRPELFDYGEVAFASQLPPNLGFAGFRVMDAGDAETDWLAFQGASYFRSSGELDQYGLSARGIAIDTALPGKNEEFPRFTEFWIEPRGEVITVYALLDGNSVTGAYRFDCRHDGEVVMDIRAEIFQREDVQRLGLAPLTSMYWYSETEGGGPDWRPEIHDSDGLALWTGAGERLWRPLANPPRVQTNSFMDENPRGFGLLQRDRAFHNYQDDGVFYNRRPSVWIEPLGDWGAGAVQLVEIPTNEEIYDNIVVYWVPADDAAAGHHWAVDYRLHWVAEEPYPATQVGRVRATRTGWSGTPGLPETRDPNGRKFVIDFEGGPIETLEQRYDIEMVVGTSAGRIENPYALKVVDTPYWRGVFDLIAPADTTEPVDLRAYLRLGDRTLTETWIYQYFPE